QQGAQRFGAAEVEVPVAQPQLLADLGGIDAAVDQERWRLGGRQNGQVGRYDLDVSCRGLATLALRPQAHCSRYRHDVLAAQRLCDVERLCLCRLHDDLHDAGAVPDVEEDKASQVAAAVDPALEDDATAFVVGPQVAAHVGPRHAADSSRALRSSWLTARCSPVRRSFSCHTPASRSLWPLSAACVAPRLSASPSPLPGARRWYGYSTRPVGRSFTARPAASETASSSSGTRNSLTSPSSALEEAASSLIASAMRSRPNA